MRYGCAYSLLFVLVAMALFALVAPLIFGHGAVFEKLGQAAGTVILIVVGPIGFVFGMKRKKPR